MFVATGTASDRGAPQKVCWAAPSERAPGRVDEIYVYLTCRDLASACSGRVSAFETVCTATQLAPSADIHGDL
eukprot:2218828-Alexandrium_andersonii.AAC.1